jgi:hypothetical protein
MRQDKKEVQVHGRANYEDCPPSTHHHPRSFHVPTQHHDECRETQEEKWHPMADRQPTTKPTSTPTYPFSNSRACLASLQPESCLPPKGVTSEMQGSGYPHEYFPGVFRGQGQGLTVWTPYPSRVTQGYCDTPGYNVTTIKEH